MISSSEQRTLNALSCQLAISQQILESKVAFTTEYMLFYALIPKQFTELGERVV